MKDLLAVRKALKLRKPTFKPQDSHKLKRIKKSWRRPMGSDSKMRQHFRGYCRNVSTGWRSPVAVRGLHPTGKAVVMVAHEKDIEKIHPDKQCALLSGLLGLRKKVMLMELLEKKKISVVNVKDTRTWIANVKKKKEDEILTGKMRKKDREDKKKKAPKEKKKEKDISETVSEEEKKAQEKKENDKLLMQEQ